MARRTLLLLLLLALPAALPAQWFSHAWEFDTPAGLAYDPAKIEVAGGVARLRPKLLDAGTALSLNSPGSNHSAWLSAGPGSGLELGDDSFLFVTWLKLRDLTATHALFHKRTLSAGRVIGALVQLVPNEAGYTVRVLLGDEDQQLELNSSPSIRDGGWHQVALGVDRVQGRAQLYLDGRPFGAAWVISALDGGLDSFGLFTIGYESASAYLRGDVDETHFFRWPPGVAPDFLPLVQGHFDDAVTDTSRLVSAWRFDDGGGTDGFGSNDLFVTSTPSFPTAGITRYAADGPMLQTSCVNGGGTSLYTADHDPTHAPLRGELRYQLSGDGATWWTHDHGAGWRAATSATAADASLLYEIREHLPDAPFAGGPLCARVFFTSDGLYPMGLEELEVRGPPGTVALVADTVAGRPAPGSFHVIFETDDPAEAFVEYRRAGTGEPWLATPTDAGGTVFGVDVTGLDPAVTYEYRARFRPRGTSLPFAASGTKQLPVAPPANAVADFEFAVWGDSRPPGATALQPQAFYRLMEQVAGDRPVFHVAVGDNVNLSGSLPFGAETAIDYYRGWRDAYDIAGGTGYLFFALGNHDEGFFDPERSLAAEIRGRATVQPTDGDAQQRYFSWRWGDALFAAMDGSLINPRPAQLSWLYQTLQQPARWKFVFNHYPLFNSARGVSDTTIRNDMHANFLATGVGIVFQAHDHWYADTEVDGIHYTTSGGGGSTLAQPNAQFSTIIEHHYLRVRVQEYATTVRAIRVNEDGTPGPQLARYCVRANDAPWDNIDGDPETDVCDEDDDADGVADADDNCRLAANASQRDTNGDGYGNLCDADFDDNGIVNAVDLALFRQAFGSSSPHHDLDGNGFVNAGDLARFRSLFGAPPGPGAD